MESKKMTVGTIFLAIGLAIIVFSYFYFVTRDRPQLSPVPYERPPKAVNR